MPEEITGSDWQRRRFLVNLTSVMAGVGCVGLALPFVLSMLPSERARVAGAPVEVDISKLQPGEQITAEWRSKPVWILHRTQEMLNGLTKPSLLAKLRDPESKVESQQPDYAANEYRSIKATYLVVIATCTHLGCVPSFRPEVAPADLGPEWPGGYFCPCHGSRFDFAGRVYNGVPAPTNLVVPPYQFISDLVIRIGVDPSADA